MTVGTTYFGDVEVLAVPFNIPCTESYEWATDLLTSHKGVDVAYKIRSKPRRILSFTVQARDEDVGDLFLQVYEKVTAKWAVPMWMEAEQITTTINAGDIFIEVDVSLADYEDDSLAIIWQDKDTWEIVEVAQVGAGWGDLWGYFYGGEDNVLIVNGTVQNTYTSGFIIPVRTGRVSASRASKVFRSETKFLFRVEDNVDRYETDYTQYKGYDTYFFPLLNISGSVPDIHEVRVDSTDNMTGVVTTYTPWTYSRLSRSYRTLRSSRQSARELKAFLHKRAGKYSPFWMPTFEKNLTLLSTGSITTTVDVKDIGTTSRTNLAFQKKDGTWVLREIVGEATPSSGVRRYTLDSSLGLTAGEINKISFLGLYRLNTDRVDLQWITDKQCETTFPIVEMRP